MPTPPATPTTATASDRARWLAKAQSLIPKLRCNTLNPEAWDRTRPLGRRDILQLDLARHLVGHFRFRLEPDGVVDAPTRLRLIFAERPEDLALYPEPHTAQLSRAWVQDEVITLDDLPAEVALPRRYAFRYVRIDVIDTSRAFKIRLADASADSLTSADEAAVPPLPADTPDDRRCHAGSCTPAYFVRKYVPRLYLPSDAHPTPQGQTPPRPRHAV